MITFAEEIMLLTLDDDTGKFTKSGTPEVNYALAGAVLMDLALLSKIDADLKTLRVVDTSPTGEDLLDGFLEMIGKDKEQNTTQYWVSLIAEHAEEIQNNSLAKLVERGILQEEEKKILWVFETRRYPMIDDKEEKEVKKRMLDLLLSDDIPSPRDVVLICLVDTCGLFPTILNRKEVDRLEPRITQLKKLDLIGQAVTASLQRLNADIAKAMMMLPF